MGLEGENQNKALNAAFQLNEQPKWSVRYGLHVNYQSPLASYSNFGDETN